MEGKPGRAPLQNLGTSSPVDGEGQPGNLTPPAPTWGGPVPRPLADPVGSSRRAGTGFGERGYRFKQARRLETKRRGAAPEDDPGGAKSRKSWPGSGVLSGSRGACILRTGLANEWIYKRVWKGASGTLDQPAPRQEAHLPEDRRAAAPGRVDMRPGIFEEKSRVGGREGDTGVRHRGACRWWTAPPGSCCWRCSASGRPGKRATRCASVRARTRSSCMRWTTARGLQPTGRLPGRWKRCSVSRSRTAA